MNPAKLWQKGDAKKILTLLLGAAILSFGMYNIHRQAGVTEGGVLGMILLLKHWFGISPSISGLVMDITCYIIGFRFLGKAFAKYSVIASLFFSLFYKLWEQFPPVIPDLTPHPLIAAVLGGLFVGIGVGLIVRIGGAAGGDDALALAISHVTKCSISKAYLFTDLVVLALSLSYIPFSRIFYSLITVFISSNVIEFVQKYKPHTAQDNHT